MAPLAERMQYVQKLLINSSKPIGNYPQIHLALIVYDKIR